MPDMSSDDYDREERREAIGCLVIMGLGVLLVLHVLGVIDLLH